MNYIGFDNQERKKRSNKIQNMCSTNEDSPLEEKTLVSGVVLSLWDHICGPREEKVWHKRNVPHSVLSLNAPFTLQGQMKNMHDTSDEEVMKKRLECIEDKFLVLSEYFSSSIIFCSKYNGQVSTFSLAFVFRKKVLNKYLYMHHIIRDRMIQLVEMYKHISICENSQKALLNLDKALPEMLMGLHGLFFSSPMEQVVLGNTLFAKPKLDGELKLFLATVVTSHLQTGCTLVVGQDERLVREWVETLSLFLLPHQRNFSRASIQRGSENYIPDLALQGLVCQDDHVKDDQIIKSMHPTTLVVLQGSEPGNQENSSIHDTPGSFFVKQTHPYHEYVVIRHDYQEEQRRRLAHTTQAEGNLWDAKEDLFRPVQTSQVITEILDKVDYLPHDPLYLRQGYLAQIMSLLVRKAIVLITYVEALRDKEAVAADTSEASGGSETTSKDVSRSPARSPFMPLMGSSLPMYRSMEAGVDKGCLSSSKPETWPLDQTDGTINSPTLTPNQMPPSGQATIVTSPSGGMMEPRETKRRIRMDLGLEEGCYFVLLGIAEKLKPGTFIYVAGNPAWIEEKLIELFERF